MNLSLGHRQKQTIHQQISVRVANSLAHGQQFALRMELVQELRNERFEPKGSCPGCGHRLEPQEILKGFNNSPTDFTTYCPRCGTRFEPILVCYSDGSSSELPFYCGLQTLDQLKSLGNLSPEVLARKHQAVYRSAIVHYGSIKSAFAKIGVDYRHQEISGWQAKILPYLGKMPDTLIAGCIDQPARLIRKMRLDNGIRRFSLTKLQDSIQKNSR